MLPRNHPRLVAAALATGTIIFLARRRLVAYSPHISVPPSAPRLGRSSIALLRRLPLRLQAARPPHGPAGAAPRAHGRHAAHDAQRGCPSSTRATTGFRHVHQLDYDSGVLALNGRAAGAAGKSGARRRQVLPRARRRAHELRPHARRGHRRGRLRRARFLTVLEGAPGCTGASAATTDVYTVARGALNDGRRVSKLLLKPASGRRHQLRLHCVALGHPIVGDAGTRATTRRRGCACTPTASRCRSRPARRASPPPTLPRRRRHAPQIARRRRRRRFRQEHDPRRGANGPELARLRELRGGGDGFA